MGAEDMHHRYDDSPGGEVTGELHSFCRKYQTVFYGLNLYIKLFLALPSGLFFGG